MNYLQENLSYILILFSLCISFIGTFTKNYKKESTGQEKLTIWGYIIGTLLIVSAAGTFLSTSTGKKQDAEKIHQDSIKLAETGSMLSQQRFINLLSVINDYSLKDTPLLIFEYPYKSIKGADRRSFEPEDYSYYNKLQTFPGFGMHVDTLSLDLDLDPKFLNFLADDLQGKSPNDSTYFFTNYNQSTQAKPLLKKENQLTYFSSQNDGIIQYNFGMTEPKNLPVLLYNLRGGKNIGALQIINSRQPINGDAKKTIEKMFSPKNCRVYFRILLKNGKLRSINPCIEVPVDLKIDFPTENHVQINLKTKDPELTNTFL